MEIYLQLVHTIQWNSSTYLNEILLNIMLHLYSDTTWHKFKRCFAFFVTYN